MSEAPCAVCRSEGAPAVQRGVRDHVTGERFSVIRCRTCGFARTDPVPDSLDPYYPVRYRRYRALAAAVLRRLYLWRVGGWRSRLPRSGVALELGAGSGWMLGALREHGWTAFGTERALPAAAAARTASGAPVFVGELASVREGPILDLVIMFHVLEHLPDPLAALRDVAARLRPGGTVVLGLPNMASWQGRASGRHWLHLDVPRHLSHFSPDSIERALEASGLRMTQIRFRSVEHDPLGWVQSALDALGFEQGLLIRTLTGMPRRAGTLATAAALAAAVPLGIAAVPLAMASWAAGRGAVMEVWAVRDRSG